MSLHLKQICETARLLLHPKDANKASHALRVHNVYAHVYIGICFLNYLFRILCDQREANAFVL